jgi:hypothetical protein
MISGEQAKQWIELLLCLMECDGRLSNKLEAVDR